jgi:hypothetical protein
MLEAGMLAEIVTKNGAAHVVPVAIPLQLVVVRDGPQKHVTVGVPLKDPEGRAFVTAF